MKDPKQMEIPKELLYFLNGFSEPKLLIDINYRIIGANKAYEKIFSENKPLIGRKCHEVSHHYLTPCDQHGEACPLSAARDTKETCREFHVHFTPRGQEHVSIELTPILNEDGEPVMYIESLHTQPHSSALPHSEGLVGKSQSFVKMLGLIERVAPSEVSILLLGESGTGKEVVAKMIHKKSNLANKPFVVVECSGLTDSLFESEMFGHEKGSFTGAISNKKGLVEVADGGTLFLDEVGDIPLNLQVKLLRLIESKTYRRVGSTDVLKCNFRLICATHKNLEQMVRDGTFRSDLYYRISSFPIILPSLRERKEDIPLLAESLLKKIAPNRGLALSPSSVQMLEEFEFKGNIRELRNMLERASLMTDGKQIQPHDLVGEMKIEKREYAQISRGCASCQVAQPLHEIESKYLQCLVREHGEDLNYLSSALGVSKRTVYRMLNKIKTPSTH